jgi:hypothetical protein
MKKIEIIQRGTKIPVILIDEDETSLDEYTHKLSALLELSKVSILSVTSGNFIVRPHKIISILVSEGDTDEIRELNNTEYDAPEVKKEEEEHEDIITDMD